MQLLLLLSLLPFVWWNKDSQSTEGRSYKGKPRKIKQQNTHTNTK